MLCVFINAVRSRFHCFTILLVILLSLLVIRRQDEITNGSATFSYYNVCLSAEFLDCHAVC
jgi:hypothetical protein